MATKIALNNLYKRFGSKHVLQGASMQVAAGTTQVILGGSGSGKSVLLKCLLGLLPVDAGTVQVDGHPTTGLTERQRTQLMTKFGMLFQSGALFDSLSVWENVAFVLRQRGVSERIAKDTAIAKLAMVGLPATVADMNPADLSGGMRKRVGLARAICHNPEIILYDEPTTGLDPITSDVINDLILKLQAELRCTSIVITHDMTTAFKVANRVAFLYEGKFLEEGPVAQFRTTTNPFVRQFVEGRAEGPIKIVV
jgi:phospholipid/cholesterol/gamma-HCH transport system ATP-binding protein